MVETAKIPDEVVRSIAKDRGLPKDMPLDVVRQLLADREAGASFPKPKGSRKEPTMGPGSSAGAPFSPTAQLAPGAETRRGEVGTTEEQSQNRAMGAIGKQAAEMAPFVAAAPLTGGMSLLGAAGTMGLAGLASGGIREGIEAIGGARKSAKQLATSLSMDTLLGAGSELGLRPIMNAMHAAPQVAERHLVEAAQKSEAGQKMVDTIRQSAYQSFERRVASKAADPLPAYKRLVENLAKVPRGTGPVGEMLAGAPEKGSAALTELVDAVEQEIRNASSGGLGPGSTQGMDALVRMHSKANQLVKHLGDGVDDAAREAASVFANDLRKVITDNLTPAERKAFEAIKNIDSQKFRWEAGHELAKVVLRKGIAGTAGAALMHSPVGAAAGIGADLALQAAEKKVVPAVLNYMFRENKLAFQAAIKAIEQNPKALSQIATKSAKALLRGLPMPALRDMLKQAEPK